jgi:transcriptional antiterminator RfaH
LLHWYVLHVKPNAEYQVTEALAAHQVETFLPTIKSQRPRPGRETTPLFPSYLFAHIDFEATGYGVIAWLPGMRRVVAVDRRPAIVEDTVIEALRVRMDAVWAQGGWLAHNLQPGDPVVIRSGPLEGLAGVFDRPTTGPQRVRILLNFLGQARPVDVALADLEPVRASKGEGIDEAPANPPDAGNRRRRSTRGKGRRIHYPE